MQKLLSICIPTYNRSNSLKKLIKNIILQLEKNNFDLEICISNNHSEDRTKETVLQFQKEYPNLIFYSENETNLGFDQNLLKVVSMARGDFIWTFSDDDLIIEGGLKQVIEFIEENKLNNIGSIAVKDECFFLDNESNSLIKYHSSVDDSQEEKYGGIGIKEIVEGKIPFRFVSALIFNRTILNKIIDENEMLIKKGIGNFYMHTWLLFLLSVLNTDYKCFVLNRPIVVSSDTETKYKFYMEDHFMLILKGKKELFGELEKVIDASDKELYEAIKNAKGYPILTIIYTMALFKSFGLFELNGSKECIKLSFRNFSFISAILLSTSFVVIYFIPKLVMMRICKLLLKIKYKKNSVVEKKWFEINITFTKWNKGDRRVIN